MALAFQHIEHRAVHVAVALTVAAGREAIDVALDRLGDLGRTGIDDLLAEILRAAFPLQVLGVIDARLGEQFVYEFAIGAFECADEGALFGPALPYHRLFCPAVMTRTGRFLQNRRFTFCQCKPS